MRKKSIGIVGCGWLGKALANVLVQQNYAVTVSTQHEEKISALAVLGAQVELFSLSENAPSSQDFQSPLFQQSCLIIAIPPGIRQGKADYPDKIKHLITLAQAGGVKQIIMISSTAIYNGLTGDVDESATIDLSSTKTRIMYAAEEEALSFNGNTIILRLSGLVGPDRHPGKFLRSGRMLAEPEAITNLIHQKDAVGLLLGLVKGPEHTNIYNGASHTHISKRQYYEQAALSIGAPVPTFKELAVDESAPASKKIMSTKIRQRLDYTFSYDDLCAWLS